MDKEKEIVRISVENCNEPKINLEPGASHNQ